MVVNNHHAGMGGGQHKLEVVCAPLGAIAFSAGGAEPVSDTRQLTRVLQRAKRWSNSVTEHNRNRFLDEFNGLSEEDQIKAVARGGQLGRILIGWTVAARMEFEESASQA